MKFARLERRPLVRGAQTLAYYDGVRGVVPVVLPRVSTGIPPTCFVHDAAIFVAPRLAFRSQAPPTLL